MSTRKITILTAAVATLGLGLALTACSSGSSSSSGTTPSSSTPATPGPSLNAKATLKSVSDCLSSHGADPSSLVSVLTTGSTTLTSAQLDALRTASAACASTVPTTLNSRATGIGSCLSTDGYHLSGSNPLSQLFSLDLTNTKVAADVQACVSGAAPGASSSPAS